MTWADEVIGRRTGECYRQGAEHGEVNAMFNFGGFLSSAGQDADAIRWYEEAARQGNVRAAIQLAALLDDRFQGGQPDGSRGACASADYPTMGQPMTWSSWRLRRTALS
ncbi:hypothetical protein J5X84_45135, partial [Streptosporangiaceae bacterium NEAU-GS5]|nr:hypothetical protein [Streptosporangiaceae bacterium NEAU-GS5]